MIKDLSLMYVACCLLQEMRSVLRNNWDFSLALSDHQKTSILLKVSKGETPAAIARSLGIHRATVGRVIERSKRPAQATRKRGRGDKAVSFRVSSGERDGLDRLVSSGLAKNRSEVFRKMLRVLTGYFDPDPDPAHAADLRGLLSELSAIGNNLNQATRAFHKDKQDRGIATISPEHP
ncbi:MAG: helix-turn-helix domain-containing protein [Planktotalea arctica]